LKRDLELMRQTVTKYSDELMEVRRQLSATQQEAANIAAMGV